MSQESYSREHLERYLPVATAAASQVPETAPSLPNTLPYGPHRFATAGAPSGSLFPPTLPPFFGPGAPFPSLPEPPSFSLPPIGRFSAQPPHHSSRDRMTIQLLDDDAEVQRARAEAKAAAAKGHEKRSANPSKQNAPAPETTSQPYKRRSRLPSNKVPRKRPLSADGRPPGITRRNTPTQSPAQRSKASQQRPTKASLQNANHPTGSGFDSRTSSSLYPMTSESAAKRGTPGPSNLAFSAWHDTPSLDYPYLAPSISRNQPKPLDADDEASHPVSLNGPRGTAESSSPPAAAADSPPQAPSQPIFPSKDPRPRYDYSIPEALRGVYTALGHDNWNEYLALMEDLWTGDITIEEFAAGTKRICAFADNRIRKRMNSLMAREIVMPHPAQLSDDGGEERRGEVEETLAE